MEALDIATDRLYFFLLLQKQLKKTILKMHAKHSTAIKSLEV